MNWLAIHTFSSACWSGKNANFTDAEFVRRNMINADKSYRIMNVAYFPISCIHVHTIKSDAPKEVNRTELQHYLVTL